MKYKCSKCNNRFDKPWLVTFRFSEPNSAGSRSMIDLPPNEHFEACPKCGEPFNCENLNDGYPASLPIPGQLYIKYDIVNNDWEPCCYNACSPNRNCTEQCAWGYRSDTSKWFWTGKRYANGDPIFASYTWQEVYDDASAERAFNCFKEHFNVRNPDTYKEGT